MKKSSTILKVSGLHFSYGDKAILKNVSFAIKEGETIGIIGESGSGKTSLLKLIGGLLKPENGTLLFDGSLIPGPDERLIAGHEKIKLVHQDFDLMPYLSVKENMLRNSLSESNAGRERILKKFKKQLRLRDVESNRAADTSGGQKQRIAMATAISARPDVLLLDEPFSNLDYPLKMELIQLLKTEWKPRAMIVVTHEPSDILKLADRILVMHKGRIVQKGESRKVYEYPKNEQVGKLLGPINILTTEVAALFGIESESDIYLRPHQFQISEVGVEAEVLSSVYLGGVFEYEVQLSKSQTVLKLQNPRQLQSGDNVKLKLSGKNSEAGSKTRPHISL